MLDLLENEKFKAPYGDYILKLCCQSIELLFHIEIFRNTRFVGKRKFQSPIWGLYSKVMSPSIELLFQIEIFRNARFVGNEDFKAPYGMTIF